MSFQPASAATARLRIDVEGTELPGRRCGPPGERAVYENAHVGLQRGREVVEIQPGDAGAASWTLQFEVRDLPGERPDFRGREVQGRRGDRFLYLSWGSVDGSGRFAMFRRAKLMLSAVQPEIVAAARRPGARLVARLVLTGRDGGPLCASVRPPVMTWSVGESG